MAMSPPLVWEVRTTGNAANGGAFRAGSSGMDYSQQDTAQVTYADLTVDATTNTNVTSSANPFTSAHVGNVIKISSTSPWSPGYYEVMSVTSRVATLDRSPAATGSAGGIGRLGGAADHPLTIAGAVVASNVVWLKAGTYTIASPGVNFAASCAPSNTVPASRLSGYGTTRGDGVRATLTAGTAYANTVLATGQGWWVANIEVKPNGSNHGIVVGAMTTVSNCKVSGAAVYGLNLANTQCAALGNEVTGCSGNSGILLSNASFAFGNYVHDNTTTGITTAFDCVVSRNLVVNNTGATSDGIAVGGAASTTVVTHNTVHGSGRHGLRVTGSGIIVPPIQNNIFSSNGGFGAVFSTSAGTPALPPCDGNAYYANTSGARSNGDDTTVNPQNASGAYTNPLDKILAVSPFVNAAAGDFSLNNTAGGGAACRGAGVPAAWPGTTVANSLDMGAAQHQASVASAGGGRVIGSGMIQAAVRRS